MSVQRNMTKSRSPAVAVGGGRPRGRCGPASATGGYRRARTGSAGVAATRETQTREGGCHLAAARSLGRCRCPRLGLKSSPVVCIFCLDTRGKLFPFQTLPHALFDESREAERSRVLVLGFLTPPVGVEALHNAQYGRGVWRNMLDDRNTNNLAGDHQSLFGLIAIARDALEDRT